MGDYTPCVMYSLLLSVSFAVASLLASGVAAIAQPAFPMAKTLDAIPSIEYGDARMIALADSFVGQWRSEGDSTSPPLTLRVVHMRGRMLTQPLYVEMVRDGDEAAPVRQWVLSFYRGGEDELRARVYEFPMGSGLRGMCVGLWGAPEYLPLVTPGKLDAVGEMRVEMTDQGDSLSAVMPFLLNHETHWTMSASWVIGADTLDWKETIFDRKGDALPRSSVQANFHRDGEIPRAETREMGVKVIDLHKGQGAVAEKGDELVYWYTGWLLDGTVFETNRLPGKTPLQVTLPPEHLIDGWKIGLPGIMSTETHVRGGGGVRKILVPPAAGMGSGGGVGSLAVIPPDSSLIFLIEMVAMKDNTTPPPVMVEDPFTEVGQQPPPGMKKKPSGGGGG